MKKKRGIFAGRQQTPPAIPPTQILSLIHI